MAALMGGAGGDPTQMIEGMVNDPMMRQMLETMSNNPEVGVGAGPAACVARRPSDRRPPCSSADAADHAAVRSHDAGADGLEPNDAGADGQSRGPPGHVQPADAPGDRPGERDVLPVGKGRVGRWPLNRPGRCLSLRADAAGDELAPRRECGPCRRSRGGRRGTGKPDGGPGRARGRLWRPVWRPGPRGEPRGGVCDPAAAAAGHGILRQGRQHPGAPGLGGKRQRGRRAPAHEPLLDDHATGVY